MTINTLKKMNIISTAEDQEAAHKKFEKTDPQEVAYTNTKSEVVKDLLEKQDSNVQRILEQTEQYKEFRKQYMDPGPEGEQWKYLAEDEADPAEFTSEMIRSWIYGIKKRSGENIRLEDWDEDFMKTEESKSYPGSRLGPDPQDDLVSWANWYIHNQPQTIYKGEPWEPGDSIAREDVKYTEHGTEITPKPLTDFLQMQDRNPESFSLDDAPEIQFKNFFAQEDIDSMRINADDPVDTDLKSLPPDMPWERNEMMEHIDKWSLVNIVKQVYNERDNAKAVFEKLHEQDGPYWEGPKLPSVKPYFEMLPKYYKEHRTVQNLVNLLEKRHPYLSRERKEKYVNRLCSFLTPKNPEIWKFLQELESPSTKPQNFDELIKALGAEDDDLAIRDSRDALTTSSSSDSDTSDSASGSEFTSSSSSEMDDLAKDKLLLEEVGAEYQAEKGAVQLIKYDKLPDYGIDWFTRKHENPNGPIPSTLTYYDNDDGFWDDWIKYKRERAGAPEMYSREFFKH